MHTHTDRVSETVHFEPFQKFLAHFHGAGQEGAVRQEEVLDVSGIHHRRLLHQVHDQTFRGALIQRTQEQLIESMHAERNISMQLLGRC